MLLFVLVIASTSIGAIVGTKKRIKILLWIFNVSVMVCCVGFFGVGAVAMGLPQDYF